VLAALTGTMLFLTRPDGVLISGMCWLGSWWIARRDEARRGPLALAVAIWTLSGVGYAAWKWWMFPASRVHTSRLLSCGPTISLRG